MWIKKESKLKTQYYRSFVTLIVIPIFLVILVSLGAIRMLIQDSAIRNIQRIQENITEKLASEVNDAWLRLSHFVYTNNGEVLEAAASTDTDEVDERYNNTRKLMESFNYIMLPTQDIISVMFYMKDGKFTYLKDSLRLPMEEVKQADWYQSALKKKNVAMVGSYKTNVTYSSRTVAPFIIVVGMSPGLDVDKQDKIEMVSMFLSSDITNLIKRYQKEPNLGSFFLMDDQGQVIFSGGGDASLLPEDLGSDRRTSFRQRMKGNLYTYVISDEPVTGWRVVNVLETYRLTESFNKIASLIIIITVVLFGLFYRFSYYFLKNIIQPVNDMVEGLKQVEDGSLEVHIKSNGQSEIRTMIHSFNRMVRRLKILIAENEEEQQKKHEAEMRALQSQINPHFLVNSLSSIRFMAQVSKFDGIRKMAEALIKILSCSFRSNAGFYSVREELEVLESYVYLMKIRYSDGFEIRYHIEEACMDVQIPRLILQPLVENSIVHGLGELIDVIGVVDLTIRQEQDMVVLVIEDNGKGMTQEEIGKLLDIQEREQTDNSSIGVTNVCTRLRLNYGKRCEIGIESKEGCYTRTIIKLPCKQKGGTDL